MKSKRLNTNNKLYTPKSGTTVHIDYSDKMRVLEVEFLAGKVYHYKKVEPEVWEEYKEIVNSGQSSGVYINLNIKPNYNYEEVS